MEIGHVRFVQSWLLNVACEVEGVRLTLETSLKKPSGYWYWPMKKT